MLIGSGDRFAKVFSSLRFGQNQEEVFVRSQKKGLTSASVVAIAKRRKPSV
jgi:hypothetical protein